jgi:hypothetical protein
MRKAVMVILSCICVHVRVCGSLHAIVSNTQRGDIIMYASTKIVIEGWGLNPKCSPKIKLYFSEMNWGLITNGSTILT